MKKTTKKLAVSSCVLLSSFVAASPAFATTAATPDPATAGESVDIAPTDKECASIWNQLVDASADDPIYGALVVTWPDGTSQTINPLTTPVSITVPAGMTPGTATMEVYKGLVDGEPQGLYTACSGSFEIVEDATVPVVDSRTAAFLAGIGVTVVVGSSALRKRSRKDIAPQF